MTEPTPGPWQALPPQGRARLHGIFDADGGCLAECFGQKAAANARLLAAAPEMLEACASVWLMLADTGDNELRLIADECRKAIAKATEPRPSTSGEGK